MEEQKRAPLWWLGGAPRDSREGRLYQRIVLLLGGAMLIAYMVWGIGRDIKYGPLPDTSYDPTAMRVRELEGNLRHGDIEVNGMRTETDEEIHRQAVEWQKEEAHGVHP